MKIILARHGKPNIKVVQGKITAAEMGKWIADYDAAGIVEEPNLAVKQACQQSDFIISSPLQRARTSLAVIDAKPDEVIFNLREAPLPIINIPFIKLRPSTWLVIFRLCWILGISLGLESQSEARKRAKEMALYLVEKSTNYESVFSMGHGFMNKLIAYELERLGWKKMHNTGLGYWGMMEYHHKY